MKRYVVGYIRYQHEIYGDDYYVGWQSFYSLTLFDDKVSAVNFVDKLKKNEYCKNIFIAEEIIN